MHLFHLLILSTVSLAHGFKILAIFTTPTKSHYTLTSKLFTEIAKRGHEVTFITPYPQENPVKNLKEIPVESLQTVLSGPLSSMFEKIPEMNPLEKSMLMNKLQYELTKHFLSQETIQEFLKSKQQFDAVILYYYLNDALLPIAHHFKAPLILLKSMPLYVTESFQLGHPTPSSYVPNILHEYTGRMNFWQRLRNSFYDVAMILYYRWFMVPKHRQLVLDYIPGKPELYEMMNNESLVLINSHVSTNEALPLVPNAVEIGGFHIVDPKPLPEDLKKFLDDSTNGVIVFSMGSILKSIDFPKHQREALIRTFAKLKENVLWKFEEDLTDLPKNVKTMKWIPQSDILGHPNVKLLINHGGLLSSMESVHRGVPILGIPVFADQLMNMALAETYEYAIQVPYAQLTEEKFSRALNEILSNPKYRNNIKKRSLIMRDRPIKPLDNALYWIEYVIRHQGAPHLRYPGADLKWYQRNLLDVVAFVLGVIVILVIVIRLILRRILSKKTVTKQKKA